MGPLQKFLTADSCHLTVELTVPSTFVGNNDHDEKKNDLLMSGLKTIFLGLFRKQKSFVIYGRTILPCTKSYPRKTKTTDGTFD